MGFEGVEVSREQLAALVAVADAGSFSAAAKRLGKSQSAVSQNIAGLEAELGVLLFDRTGYRPRLTPIGARTLDSARRIAAELSDLTGLVRSARAGVEPTLAIAVDEFYPVDRLASALRELPARFHRTRIVLRTGALGDIAAAVEAGDVHFGVSGPLEEVPAGLVRRHVATIGLLPVAVPQHPLVALGREVTSRSAREHPQIVLSGSSSTRRETARGILSAHPWSVGSLSTKRELILAGLGWGTLPRHLVEDELRRGRLVKVRISGWSKGDYPVPLDAIYLQRTPPGVVGRWLMSRLVIGRSPRASDR